jgi:hypothetical protein
MKKVLFSLLLAAGAGLGITGCSNGDYSVGNNGVNPLNPPGGIDNTFGWSGTDPMSMEVNGSAWKADQVFIMDAPGMNNKAWMISGVNYAGDTTVCNLVVQKGLQAGKTVFVFYGNTDNVASYQSKMSDWENVYASTSANLGEIKITENSATKIKALFYFLARNDNGDYVNIQKGYVTVDKP